MINFRFHLASLVAVFLALGLGVVIGSTVVDRAIVDSLENRISEVERKADAQRNENSNLRSEIDRLNGYIAATQQFAVAGRLDGVAVATVAVRGINEDAVRDTVTLQQEAGGQAPGILWLEGKLADREAASELAEIVGEPGASLRQARRALWPALADRLARGDASLSEPGGDLLASLADGGFVSFETVGDEAGDDFSLASYPGPDARVLLADGVTGDLAADTVLAPLSRAIVAAGVPLVVGEVYAEVDNGPSRGARLAPVRDDEQLDGALSTVDDLDVVEGRVAAVLALAEVGAGVHGDYGFGEGAGSLTPEWESQ